MLLASSEILAPQLLYKQKNCLANMYLIGMCERATVVRKYEVANMKYEHN